MNKVFKVIWSEARNAYVVVSEIAKNHGSKSCSTKKLLTMLIATGVMTCASMAPAMAAPNVDASATVNVGKKAAVDVAENAKVNVEESAKLFVAKGSNVSVDKNVTIGKGAVSSPYVGQTGNVAIGEKALAWNGNGLQEALMDFGQGGAKVKSFFGIPYGADIVDGTKLPGSIAIGKNTVARSGSTMIGDHGYTGEIGDTTITPDGNGIMKYNNDVYSTTIGANSFNSGALASVTGVFSIASSKYDGEKKYKSYAVQNTGATIYGSMNSIESATSDAEYSGIASSVLGFANKTQNANAALIWGTGNEVTNSIESIDIDYNGWNKLSVAEAQQKAIEAMQSSKYAGGSVMAIGGGNKADYAKYSQLTGVQNKVTGTKAKAAKYDFVNGYQNTVTNASDVTAIGIKNEVTADGNKVIGDNHKVSGKDNVIFGSADEVTETTVNNAVVLGHNAKVTSEGSVALGSGSVADRANAVSVGRRDANRQIINVAAGTKDTDAVNVSQLRDATANANKGWKLSTEGGAANQVASEATVDFSGKKDAGNHQNITVSNDGNNVKIDLASELHNVTGVVNGKSRVALGTGVAGITNGQASVVMLNGSTQINGVVGIDNTGKISGVAAGINNNDAVNVGQLNKVSEIANKGWNLATNGVATEATNVKPGDFVDFSGDKNISVSHDGTKVKVELNKDIDVNSVQTNALNSKYNLSVGTMAENGIMPFFVNSTGDFYAAHNKFHVDKDGKVTATAGEIGNVVLQNGVYTGHSALRDGELFVSDASGNYSQITTKGAKLGKVTVAADGKISGVAAGAVTADSTDAVNGSQLHAVATEAGKHSKVVNGSNINVEETDLDGQKVYKVNLNKDIMLGDLTGKNVSISGTNGTIEATGAIATKDRVYADKGAKLADIDVTGDTISNGDAKLALNGAAGTAGMINGKGASVYMQDGYTVINSKVAFDQNGKISGVAAGAVTADSTDAVNGSQLHAVATEAGKHSKVVSGNNINVEETDVDGQKFYKVNMNKDIMLGDLTGKNVSISGTNGTIEATGAIATNDRVHADKGAKLADIDVTGNKISNGASSIVLDGSNVKVNDKVTIDQDGKISGVAAGEISSTSTDAINGSQLKETNDRVAANETAIKNNTEAISKLDGRVTANETAIKNNADAIGNLNTRVDGVEKLAKQHTTVAAAGDNITVTEDTNKDGGKEYKVALDKDINLDSVTTGQTVMNNDGLKVGKDVSVTATAVTAGQTSISNDGLKVNGKTYVSDSGLNANDQKITKVADGDISETSKDAVNGSQLYKTNQEVANNATNISSLSHSISNLDNRVNKVGAGAAALAALHPLDFDPDAKWDFAAGYGNYRGANAAAVGAYYRPNEDTMFSVGGTFGNGENMVNAGVSFKLGSGSSHVSTSRVAMAKEIKELRGELEAMKSAMLDANAGKKIDTSKLQLFPDVSQNHWAYEYVAQLAGNGMIEGYPDGNFAGDRPMTRYEFAAILYRAMAKGAVLSDKILSEFSHELEYFTVDTIAKDKAGNPTIQRVRTVKENKNK